MTRLIADLPDLGTSQLGDRSPGTSRSLYSTQVGTQAKSLQAELLFYNSMLSRLPSNSLHGD